MEDLLVELVFDLVGLVVGVCDKYGTNNATDRPGNSPYTMEELKSEKKYSADIANRDFDKDVYKELKSLRLRGVLSKQEYNDLVLHQKKVDERNQQFKKILSMNCNNVEETKKALNELKKTVKKIYDDKEISKESFDDINIQIEDKLVKINKMEIKK